MDGKTFWGEKDIVPEVTVIQVGEQQGSDSSAYWPVRVAVRGSYTAVFDSSSGTFTGEVEYVVRKNAFGEWVASLAATPH